MKERISIAHKNEHKHKHKDDKDVIPKTEKNEHKDEDIVEMRSDAVPSVERRSDSIKIRKVHVYAIAALLCVLVVIAGLYFVRNMFTLTPENSKKTSTESITINEVEAGDSVSVWYVGSVENGEIFDTNVESKALEANITRPKFEPFIFVVDGGSTIKGFNDKIKGMRIGEKKTIIIPPEDAYGEYSEEKVQILTLEQFHNISDIKEPKKGMILTSQQNQGSVRAVISDVGKDFITLDSNHPLAGKTLKFEIEVISKTSSSGKAKTGDSVSVWYTGSTDNGDIFDTNVESRAKEANITRPKFEPFTFVLGSGSTIKGFDNGIKGMKIGEKKILTIPAEEAYGPYSAEKVQTLSMAEFYNISSIKEPKKGMVLMSQQGSRMIRILISDVGADFVKFDFNHPLAGKALTFEIEVVSITPAR